MMYLLGMVISVETVQAYTVAEVEIYDDDIDEAQNRGFRILADYIFGNNIARNSER